MKYFDSVKGYFSKSSRLQRESREEAVELASNAKHLARYIIEHQDRVCEACFNKHKTFNERNTEKLKKQDILAHFNFGEFLEMTETYPHMEPGDADRRRFIDQYCVLECLAGAVTARTLVATHIHGRGFLGAIVNTTVGRYLAFISMITLLFIFALYANMFWPLHFAFEDWYGDSEMASPSFIVLYFLAQTTADATMIPFFAAGLGTSVYLLRKTQMHLRNRTFDPARIPGHFIRLMLGVVAGGTVVLFPDMMQASIVNTYDVSENISVGQGALAFILGYSVEIFYEGIDKVKSKFLSDKIKG